MNANSLDDPITDAKLEDLRKYPELILEIRPWRSVALCYYCLNELEHSERVLFPQRSNDIELFDRCPYCEKTGTIYHCSLKSGVSSSCYKFTRVPLEHYIVRRREIITGYMKGWFRKTPITITETQLIESKLEYSPPTSDRFRFSKI